MSLKLASLAAALPVGLMFVSVPANAHGIWFEQRAKQLVIVYGIGADDLETVKRLPLMEDIKAYDADYQPIAAQARAFGPAVVVDTDALCTVAAAVLPYGVWSRVGDGEFEKKTLAEMPEATVSTKNVKYAVGIEGPLVNPIPALPDQVLQIIPVGPIPETLGMPLTYKVIYNGKPVQGARMINDMITDPDAEEKMTGPDGTITMPVRNQGLNVVRAVYVGPSDNPKLYTQIESTATLSFALAHKPE
ncbi:DUF4198 domain-containing protein [Novosphingobium album (ex Hu et al. 2023)]|uniref:DUF4198 domain-containing protein n=1 Tax=Novosphingobium album (ex Hu et al. 2023) TaxID=2930093 RepID=A0ABT0B7X4_9SPHN|nr:DUF4198 domain-containing protein [Novosphingobium album (ex Hu et al. 2023)]MCJ2180990.1 DUF4198 domain-containing protein [Novosphingobium album (ex Hu et al. 2023)]